MLYSGGLYCWGIAMEGKVDVESCCVVKEGKSMKVILNLNRGRSVRLGSNSNHQIWKGEPSIYQLGLSIPCTCNQVLKPQEPRRRNSLIPPAITILSRLLPSPPVAQYPLALPNLAGHVILLNNQSEIFIKLNSGSQPKSVGCS